MAPPGLTIRAFQPGDALEIMRLFRDTVHNVNSRDYTPEQIEAWAPALMDEPRWHERLRANFTYVAEADGQIVGFSELERNGRIGTLYVHHRYQTWARSRLLSDMETRPRPRRQAPHGRSEPHRLWLLPTPRLQARARARRRPERRQLAQLHHGAGALTWPVTGIGGIFFKSKDPDALEEMVPPTSRDREQEGGCRRPLRLAGERRAPPFGLHGVGAFPPRHPLLRSQQATVHDQLPRRRSRRAHGQSQSSGHCRP
jgi:putative acetyltransferase